MGHLLLCVALSTGIALVSLDLSSMQFPIVGFHRSRLDLGLLCRLGGPPLWSSGQSFWLQIQRSRVRFPALPDFLSSSWSGTGSTQPREVN